ncbi:MAG: hypothetical protein F4X92_09220 [Gammaproteobacteria bacterium]|nr:hypothetical protein [Gammaproteobacteria bacterium]
MFKTHNCIGAWLIILRVIRQFHSFALISKQEWRKAGKRAENLAKSAHCRQCGFFGRCIEALPEGVRVSRFRADAASYQAGVINACRGHGARFAIRAKMDSTVQDAVAAIAEDAWQPLLQADGCLSETGSVARTVHVMGETPEAFCPVVQRKVAKRPKPRLRRTASRSCTSTSPAHICPPVGSGPMPCTCPPASCHCRSLLCLMRLSLPLKWHAKRAGTFRCRLYAMAGKVVRHARQRVLKVSPADLGLLDETLWRMRICRQAGNSPRHGVPTWQPAPLTPRIPPAGQFPGISRTRTTEIAGRNRQESLYFEIRE